jgi:hypothetical protein
MFKRSTTQIRRLKEKLTTGEFRQFNFAEGTINSLRGLLGKETTEMTPVDVARLEGYSQAQFYMERKAKDEN